MAPHAIISYDDTQNDHAALMLGRLLADAGARLTLAYVRHAIARRPDREELEHHEAEALLDRGAQRLEDSYVGRRVVMSASTADGLAWLAAEENADMIVFGSDYRTPAGHVSVCRSAQSLLERGAAAIAIAPSAYHEAPDRTIATIGILPGSADEAAIETAFSLAARLDATVVDREHGVEMLVVGSRAEAPEGRVLLSSRSWNALEEATVPVLVAARAVPLRFETLVTA